MAQQAQELRDIELPSKPLADWLAILQDVSSLVVILVLALMVVFIIRNAKWLDKSVLFAPLVLRWRLFELRNTLKKQQSKQVKAEFCRALYDWSVALKALMHRVDLQTLTAEEQEVYTAVDKLVAQTEYMVFSRDPVTRKDFSNALNHAGVLLNKIMSFKFICKCLYRGVRLRGNR